MHGAISGNLADAVDDRSRFAPSLWRARWEVLLLMLLFFVHAGDPPPGINEAHYLTKAKNFWDPQWVAGDLFVTSGKAHVMYYVAIGWLTEHLSFPATAWIGRILGWLLIAWSLQRLSWAIAPMRYASLLVGLVWIVGVEQADLAGEWVVGGTEAKVFAYGFVLLAMRAMVGDNWRTVWPLLGCASAFHVLVGGWSVIAAGFAFIVLHGRQVAAWRRQIVPLGFGGVIALLGLVPGLATMRDADPSTAAMAASIYTYERISHHLYPASFPLERFVRHGTLILTTVLLATAARHQLRLRPVLMFATGCVLIGLTGLLLGTLPAVAPDFAARLLRYYWFRMTDSVVPLATGLCIVAWLTLPERWPGRSWIVGAITAASVLLFSHMFLQRQQAIMPEACRQSLLSFEREKSPEHQLQVYRDWRAVCDWVRDNTPPDAIFLTPRHQQTFKWFAHRAEVVNWKDVPQDAHHLIEWKTRMQEIFPSRLGGTRVTIQYHKLREFRERYGVEYLIGDNRMTGGNLPLVKIYPTSLDDNATYGVYRLP